MPGETQFFSALDRKLDGRLVVGLRLDAFSFVRFASLWNARPHGVLADHGSTPSSSLNREEQALAIANQLASLPPDYGDVIVLRNFQGLAFNEVAERMQRSPGAVRMLWMRAFEALRKRHIAT